MHHAIEARIERARAALAAYLAAYGGGADDDDQSLLTDLLADLRHMAEDDKLDFAAAISASETHWEAERGEGDDIEEAYRARLDGEDEDEDEDEDEEATE